MEEKFYLQLGSSKTYLNVDFTHGYTSFNFTNILTKVTSFPNAEKAQQALSLAMKHQQEFVDKCTAFYDFVHNATPEQKDELYNFLYKEAEIIISESRNRGRLWDTTLGGVPDRYFMDALWHTLLENHDFYSVEPFCIIKKCASIFEFQRRSNWDDSTKWFNLKRHAQSYNKNWVCYYQNNIKMLGKLKKCKPTKPEPEHKINFHKIRKPSWVLCDSKIHCSSCGANIAEMKYLALPVGKSSRTTYICPICLVKIGNQVQELVDNVGQEMIDAHSKILFIKSL